MNQKIGLLQNIQYLNTALFPNQGISIHSCNKYWLSTHCMQKSYITQKNKVWVISNLPSFFKSLQTLTIQEPFWSIPHILFPVAIRTTENTEKQLGRWPHDGQAWELTFVFVLCAQLSCPTLSDLMNCSLPGSSLGQWDFPGKNTGVGCHFLLQGIYPAQRSNPHLLHWQEDSLPLNHWEAIFFFTTSLNSFPLWTHSPAFLIMDLEVTTAYVNIYIPNFISCQFYTVSFPFSEVTASTWRDSQMIWLYLNHTTKQEQANQPEWEIHNGKKWETDLPIT